ncbi:hypothetical protein ILYODFUR_019530 [Ilyodon furcidens]|uniref:Uncharacterized protein n=1 Tax=Ilyodon furcidens TaxID=33524 RepID=A0ABV0T9C5_9TELE
MDCCCHHHASPLGLCVPSFYNSLCRNLPRRYVLPLNVDEQTPLDQNLVMLPNCKATAKKTDSGEVYVTHEELHNDKLLQYGGLEFPQINYDKYNGRPYRYFYACGFGHVFADSLLKMDVHTKELKVWRYPGLYPSEPVFVASPTAAEEDDGVVLSVIITPRKEKSTFLLVLDAKTFTELGRAEVPVNIPYGTHGVFNKMG